MSKPSFTPGPWEVERSVMGCRSICAGEVLVASVEDAPTKANARLIAAAPELYEALQKASNTLAGCGMPKIAADICDAALRKARGEA